MQCKYKNEIGDSREKKNINIDTFSTLHIYRLKQEEKNKKMAVKKKKNPILFLRHSENKSTTIRTGREILGVKKKPSTGHRIENHTSKAKHLIKWWSNYRGTGKTK